MRSAAEIITIMPSVASTISTGYSKRSNFSARMKPTDMAMATPEPISATIFRSRANGSSAKAPLKAAPSPVPTIRIAPTTTMSATAR